jgi:hypothetical protein
MNGDSSSTAIRFGVCRVDGGCLYWQTLAAVERILGSPQTATFYAEVANRCVSDGCWGLLLHVGKVGAPEVRHPVRLPTRAVRLPWSGTVHRNRTVIPFARPEVGDVISDEEGNYVEQCGLRADGVKVIASLSYLSQYWRLLRATTRCRLKNIDMIHFIRAGVIGKLHIVDVSSSNPDDFRFELAGYQVPVGDYEKPRAFPVKIYADTILRNYNTVRMTAVPRVQRIRGRLAGRICHYTRLILPFFGERGHVSHLAVAIHREPGDGAEL